MRFLLCCYILFVAHTVHAGEQYHQLQRISPDEGLSQGFVTRTVQDNKGFIWIGTQMGLNIYDGYQVKSFTDPDNILSQEHILTLVIDQQGYIWASTYGAGLFKINPSTHQVTHVKAISPSNQPIYTIALTATNSLWLGTTDTLVHIDINQHKVLATIKLTIDQSLIRDILVIDDLIYVATSIGLYVANSQTSAISFIEHRPSDQRNLHSDNTKLLHRHSDDILLVGTVDGLYSISLGHEMPTTTMLISSLNILDIEKIGSDYFIATSQGLFKANARTFEVEPTLKFSDSKYQISDNNINDILKDKSGNLWLASSSQGVLVWSPRTELFTNFTANQASGLSHDHIWSIYQDNNDIVWIGTNNGLNKLDLSNSKIQQFIVNTSNKNPYQESYIYDIFAQDNDHLWLSTALGLRLFDKNTGELTTPEIPNQHQELMARSDNSINFIGSGVFAIFNTSGHYLLNIETGVLTSLAKLDQQTDSALSGHLLPQLPGYQDTILLSTFGRLVSYNTQDQSVKVIYQAINQQQKMFSYTDSWALDEKRNILWLATASEGLIGLDFTTLAVKHRFDLTSGLASNYVYNVNLEQNDTLWFSSQSGLYQLNLATFNLTQYEVSDGISANEFNSNATYKLSDGRLIYGSTRGVTLFNPTELINSVDNTKPYRVQITNISVMSPNRTFKHTGKVLNFKHDEIGLTFEYSTLEFNQQRKTRYNISLSGEQALQYKDIQANSITLSQLPPGDYQLAITAQSAHSGLVSPPTLVRFNINNAPWLTPSAKLAYFLVLLVLVWIISNRRRHQRVLLLNAHQEVLESQEQMSLALRGSGSAIWDYHILKNRLYQKRLTQDLGYHSAKSHCTGYSEHTELIHQDDLNRLRPIWLNFVDGTNDSWDVTYRMRAIDGSWVWYRDVGRVASRDIHGKPSRLTGTYTNITKAKATEIKAQLFGEAFSQIKDWVLILDQDKKPVSANKAFYDEFDDDGSSTSVTLSRLAKQIGSKKLKQYIQLFNSLEVDQSWHGEETLTTPTRGKHPVRISVNAIADSSNAMSKNVEHFVLIVSDITEQKIAEKKLQYLANFDHLTKLPNRALMLTKIEQAIINSNHHKNNIALFFIDLDRFKQVNDSLGHSIGDKLLQHIAERLRANIKSDDCVARQSGDEFIILINSFQQVDDLICIAQRLNKKLAEPVLIEQHQINISSSIGIAIYPEDASSAADLIRNADLAMFEAKKSGRNRFELFTKKMDQDSRQRHHLEQKLKYACDNRELVNHYQPIYDPQNSKIVGFELLLRWPTDDGFISPAEFIPVAEDIGLISKITEIAMEQALLDIKQWKNTLSQPYLSINLSAIHILQPGLVKHLVGLLLKHNLPTNIIRLEITESILMADKSKALACLTELNDIGFELFLDDFGTGYSSLTYIKQFPIKAIKIDQSFVRDIGKDNVNESIIKTIISLAESLNIYCIAEGVETTEQLAFLQANGCHRIQGFLISKAVPFEKTLSLLRQESVA